MKKTKVYICCMVAVISLGLFFSCKKTYTPPPYAPLPSSGTTTIAKLRALSVSVNGAPHKFTTDLNLYATVTMDETSGDIYKQDYIRDNSGTPISATASLPFGAIMLKLVNPGGLYQGDSIRLDLKGCWLDVATSGGYLEIDSVNVPTMVQKLKSNVPTPPLMASIPQVGEIYAVNTNNIVYPYDAQLVQLNSVEFSPADTGSGKYFGVQAPVVVNTTYQLLDCNLHGLSVYTSGYSNFAESTPGAVAPTVPDKNGSIVVISSVYSGAMQLTIHSFPEIKFTNPYCGAGVRDSLNIVFNTAGISNKAAINLYGWNNIATVGSLLWMGMTPTGFPTLLFPSASTYNSTDPDNVMWLITPPILYDKAKTMSFQAITEYNPGNINLLDVYISTNFNGTNATAASVSAATWTSMTLLFENCGFGCGIPIAATNYTFQNTSSAPVPITGVSVGQTFNIAFRYKGTGNLAYTDSSATYGINNIVIH